jgi:hypothetical protein
VPRQRDFLEALSKMSDQPFSSEHRARFRELRAVGELTAVNVHNENLACGPWLIDCDLGDSDAANRLEARFRVAVRKAAFAAGAPYRVNRLDWWISKLAGGKPLPFIQGLIERSAEFCEELETNGLELGLAPRKPGAEGGLYRDRYLCDCGEPYFLYDGPPPSFSDPKTEFEYWTNHIWTGFKKSMAEPAPFGGLGRRQDQETREAYRDRVRRRSDNLYAGMKRWIRGLSYDLAVLQANYIIDRGLRVEAAVRMFQDESNDLIESVRVFWRESSKRLGLSYRKQEKECVDLAKPFREVSEDLRHLTSAVPTETHSGRGVVANPNPQSKVATSRQGVTTAKKRGRHSNPERRDAIQKAILLQGEAWRHNLSEILEELDRKEVDLGDFQNLVIDLGDDQSKRVSSWEDLGLADGDQRKKLIDALRKYLD